MNHLRARRAGVGKSILWVEVRVNLADCFSLSNTRIRIVCEEEVVRLALSPASHWVRLDNNTQEHSVTPSLYFAFLCLCVRVCVFHCQLLLLSIYGFFSLKFSWACGHVPTLASQQLAKTFCNSVWRESRTQPYFQILVSTLWHEPLG